MLIYHNTDKLRLILLVLVRLVLRRLLKRAKRVFFPLPCMLWDSVGLKTRAYAKNLGPRHQTSPTHLFPTYMQVT